MFQLKMPSFTKTQCWKKSFFKKKYLYLMKRKNVLWKSIHFFQFLEYSLSKNFLLNLKIHRSNRIFVKMLAFYIKNAFSCENEFFQNWLLVENFETRKKPSNEKISGKMCFFPQVDDQWFCSKHDHSSNFLVLPSWPASKNFYCVIHM